MPAFKITSLGFLCFFVSLALGSKCPRDATSKLVVCYYKGDVPLDRFDICNCTHVVFTSAVKRAENNSISPTEDAVQYLDVIKEKKKNLAAIFTLETKQDETSTVLKSENRTEQLVNGIVDFLQESQFDGVELNFKFSSDDGVSKESYASFVKKLSKTLSRHRRVKRDGYDVFEKVQDDVTTAAYTTQTPRNSTSKTQSIKPRSRKPKENNRKVREEKNEYEYDADYLTLEEAVNEEDSENRVTLKDVEDGTDEEKFLIFLRLSIEPEIIAKKYDLKTLSRYADVLSIPTHEIASTGEEHLTYHPSRLMGLSDIQNTDSILDFLTGMGAPKSKMVISLPATVLKFQLKNENKNTPRSPSRSKPQVIDQSQLCQLFSKNNWTVERDDDLTAPYAFSGKTWLAFEDEISINIKGKYILLRELAGGAIYPIDADLNDGLCTNRTGSGGYLTGILHKNFQRLERKPRALVLQSLQDEIHESGFTNVEAGVKLSEYRIVRVVDHSGAVHIVRKNTKTQFECSRQGYFSHPLGCNKFYRCVKFDQYSDEFTVFEYDCPAGLAFDERWEVCVWPGSLPHGAPCTGSSEIAPVPRAHYQCPNHEGYYADPENCRWFFACLDHARDGVTPLTAYEFRCPFGLVFNEAKLACDWPWLVGACGNRGAAGYLQVSAAGQSQRIHTATFINGGNLEASFGKYGNTDQEDSFVGFGKKFGSNLRVSGGHNAEVSYQGAQSAGFGYIAGESDDDRHRASFASFPDYEISGGRIPNKGGVVLEQNIAGISAVGAGGVGGGSKFVSYGGVAGTSGNFAGAAGNIVGAGGAGSTVGVGRAHVVGATGAGSVVGVEGAGSIVGTGGAGRVHIVGAGNAGSIVGTGGAGSIVGTGGAGKAHIVGIGGAEQVHIVGVGGSGNGVSAGGIGTEGAGNVVGTVNVVGTSGNFAGGVGTIVGAGGSVRADTVHTVSAGDAGSALGAGVGSVVGIGGAGRAHILGAGDAGSALGAGVGSVVDIGGAGRTHIVGAGNTGSVVGTGDLGSVVGVGGVGSVLSAGDITGASRDFAGGFGTTSRNFGKSSGYFQSVSTPSIKFEKPTLKSLKTNTLEISGISSGGQVSLQNTISTPKPFSVDIPSVQINAEKISQVSEQSSVSSTTPQSLIFKATPQTDTNRVTGQQISISHGFTSSQPAVSVQVPVVTPTTETYAVGGIPAQGFATSALKTDVSISHFTGAPKTELHRFGQFKQSEFLGTIPENQGSVTVGVPAVTGTSFGYSSTASGGTVPTVPISATVPVVTPKPGIQTFEYTASHGVGVSSSSATETPFVGFTQQNYKLADNGGARKSFGKALPAVQTNVFTNINEGQNFVSGNIGQAGVSFGAPVVTATPSVYSGVKTGSESAIHLSGVSPVPGVTGFVQSSIDEKVSNELKFKPQASFAVPTVTPKTEFHAFSKESAGLVNVVSNNIPLVTPKPDHQRISQGVTANGQSTISFGVPAVTPVAPFESSVSIGSGFEQTRNAEDVAKVTFNVPSAVHFEKTSTFQQKGVSQAGKQPYGPSFVTSGIQTDTLVQTGIPQSPQLSVAVQPAFGQRYSSFKQTGNQYVQIQPFSSTPKVEQTNILTEVSVEPQPIISVGSISSTDTGKTLSTPRTYSSSQNTFSQSPAVDFKSTFAQPQHVTVTTPAPVVSITPSTPASPNPFSLNVIGKSSQAVTYNQGGGINIGSSTPATTVFGEKLSTFGQGIKTFTPTVRVSTQAPLTYTQDVGSGVTGTSFYEKGYLSPVTPKGEVFGSTIQHASQGSTVQFGTNEGNQILVQPTQPVVDQRFEFVKTKPLIEERRTEYVQQQVPVQGSVTVSEYQENVKIAQPVVSTGQRYEPRDKLVELEITKSVELNPSQFTGSSGYVSRFPAQQIEIQQQPVHLISQKTFPTKQVIQPFYTKEKEIVQAQVNNVQENRYQEQSAFLQPVNIKTPSPQKQYLPATSRPSVTYPTAKPVRIDQPVVFSQEAVPVLSAFEAGRVPFTSEKETVVSKTNAYQPALIEQRPSKVNLLLPTVTEAPQFVPSQTEELAIQTHANFDSRKINKFGSTPAQNLFVQSTLKPAVNVYETVRYSAANLTTGQSGFGSGIQFSVNPKIEIPEPPREYVFGQNAYTTVGPETVTTGNQFASTESIRTGYKSSTYLPPSRQFSKTTVISAGNLDGGNVDESFDKYSGRFGQAVSGNNEKIVTKVIKGEGRGTIEVERQGSSTVQYEVSSTTAKPRSRGRQYLGGITSGVQATNKYEEYEINGGGQRSFDGNDGRDAGDVSKTTIDLKNLKVDKNKKTVIVVSQVSDANPVLVGKLAGQCSCQSNMLHLRSKGKNSKGTLRGKKPQPHPFITNEYLPPFESSRAESAGESLTQGEASSAAPETVVIDGSKSLRQGASSASEQTLLSSTTGHPEIVPSTILSSLGPDGVLSITPKTVYSDERRNRKKQFRGRTRYLPPTPTLSEDGLPLLSPVPASDIANTLEYAVLKGDESRTQNEIGGGKSGGISKVSAGAAFERYGPGGWRSFDETLQGSVDCKRPGLFRHPKYCNKFYACNYDPWEERYTLHIFNCPIHLTYDNSISACNWPVRGPACADDNLLV